MNFLKYSAIRAGPLQGTLSLSHRLGSALVRIRYQLLGGLIAGVIAPVFLRGRFERLPDQIINYDNSLLGTICALLIGYMVFRKVTALPGAGAFANVLPAFLSSYSFVIAVFFMLRLDYSRYQFLVSFILIVIWYYTVMFALARYRSSRFALVSDKSLDDVRKIEGIEWTLVPTPEAASRERELPLVVDLDGTVLTPEWERYLADEAISGRLVFNARDIIESLEGRVKIERLAHNSFGHLAPDSLYAPAKRYVDLMLALVALIVLSPVFIVVFIWVKADSRGPAIFSQLRMGYRGKPFTVYKFRSMRIHSREEVDSEADMTLSDDDRVTKAGRMIRRLRLDELPQLFNIVRGDMSWIGPRPETINLSTWYETEIPFYRYRHIVRPGISGWAQVKQGHVTSVHDVREKLEYDFYYVKHFSLWTDVLIVIQTLKVLLSGHGAK